MTATAEHTAAADLDAARALAAAGVPVFVARPNPGYGRARDGREFFLPKGYHRMGPDPSALDAWQPGCAVCIVTGQGVDGIDIDPKNGANVDEHRARLAALGVVTLAEVRTPSGGAHFYVRSSGIHTAAIAAAGVDYRGGDDLGEGRGFLYAPGTSRPRYGGRGYSWAVPLDLDDLADLGRRDDEADAVEAYLSGLGCTVRTSSPTPVGIVAAEPIPNMPAWLADELADLGADVVGADGRRGLRWANSSGALAHTRSERFYKLVGACRRASLTQGQAVAAVTPWCQAVGKYAGREAAEVARIWQAVTPSGDGKKPREVPSVPTLTVVKSPGDSFPDLDAEQWDEPVPLTGAHPEPVPLDGLPGFLRRMVEAVEEQSQAPREVALAGALGTLAAATRGAWDVHVEPGWNAGPSVLWLAALASSGERKGAGTAPFTAALMEAELRLAAEVRRGNRNREAERKRLEAAMKKAEAEGDPTAWGRLADAMHEARARPVPGLVISEATTEALGSYMTAQGGALAIMGTEAAAFQTAAGRYDKSRQGNFSLLNHAYDGELFADLRINRPGIRVERPALTWAVAVQPEVMAGYADAQSEGSGFLARFLLLLPESRQGHIRYRTEPVPVEVAEEWGQVVESLHAEGWRRYAAMVDELPDVMGKPARVDFTPAAADVIRAYGERIQTEIAAGGAVASLGGWAAKAPTRVARIAAVMALGIDPTRRMVEAEHVDAAMTLADPLTAHALAGFAVLRQASRRDPLHRLVDVLGRLGKPVITTREVHRAVHGQAWAGGTEDVRRALADLDGLGYVRMLAPDAPGRGRPSERWAVHPKLTT